MDYRCECESENVYLSRLHATNGIVSVAVDSLNGEILEFVRESTWDNAAKNHVRNTRSPLDGILHTDKGDMRIYVPRYIEIRSDPRLTPQIKTYQREKSARVTMVYPMLVAVPRDGQHAAEAVDISAEVTVDLPEGECRTLWHLSIENRTGWEIGQICFPAADGLWLGETWEDDVLVMPRFAGWQVVNPSKKLASAPPCINWKWQEYIYGYNLG